MRLSKSNGFTLIELLVVLGILVIIVGSSLVILTSILKGTNKATVNAEVKQNGQAVLDTLEKDIRNAIDAQAIVPNYLKIYRSSGVDPLHIKCVPGLIPTSNGWIGTVASPAVVPPVLPDSAFVSLTNKDDLISGVHITGCNFNVVAAASGSPSIVSITFVINQAVGAPSRKDFTASSEFRTTISLRQYR